MRRPTIVDFAPENHLTDIEASMHRWKAASALLKTELVHQACDPSRDAARQDLFVYIEGYYNRQRLHSALGYITPEQQGIANFQPALTSTGAMVSK